MSIVARRQGFDSRATLGLRAPRSVSHNVNPRAGGAGYHYMGPAWSASNHNSCRQAWRNIQAFHMSPGALGTTNGASDIGYNAGVCPHGIVLAGRGWGVRSAANGTNDSNTRYLAVCALIGAGQTPTRAMREAMAWVVWEWRRLGAGREVRSHSAFTSTACPGNPLRADASALHNKNIAVPSAPPTQSKEDALAAISGSEAQVLNKIAEAVAKRPNPSNDIALGTMIRRTYVRNTRADQLIRHTVIPELTAVLAALSGQDVVATVNQQLVDHLASVRKELVDHRAEMIAEFGGELMQAIADEMADVPAEVVETAVARALQRTRLVVE